MSHVHTIKDLELELSFIYDKNLLVTCRNIEDGKQLVFRKGRYTKIENMIFIHEDLENDFKDVAKNEIK